MAGQQEEHSGLPRLQANTTSLVTHGPWRFPTLGAGRAQHRVGGCLCSGRWHKTPVSPALRSAQLEEGREGVAGIAKRYMEVV